MYLQNRLGSFTAILILPWMCRAFAHFFQTHVYHVYLCLKCSTRDSGFGKPFQYPSFCQILTFWETKSLQLIKWSSLPVWSTGRLLEGFWLPVYSNKGMDYCFSNHTLAPKIANCFSCSGIIFFLFWLHSFSFKPSTWIF